MAINFDHTSSSSITLKGQSGASPNDSFTFILPTTNSEVNTILVSGSTEISSISGLQTALDNKFDISGKTLLTGILTGNTAGKIPVLNSDGKLDESIIPSIAIRDTFLVNLSGDIVNLTSAHAGDLAIATGSKLNYILSSRDISGYTGFNNWKLLETTQQSVHSVNNLQGHVVLDGSNIFISSGHYSGYSINNMIQNVYDTKITDNDLIDFAHKSDVDSQLTNFVSLSGLTGVTGSGSNAKTGILDSYLTKTGFASGLSGYQTISGLTGLLSGYVGTGDVGTASKLNTGLLSGNVVLVESDGKINPSLLPKIAITDTFVLNETGLLTGLVAQKGDIGIITGQFKGNYILTGIDASDIQNWQTFASPPAVVGSVNSITPTNGNVNITTSDIYASGTSGNNYNYDGQSISQILTGLHVLITGIGDTYLTSGKASGFLESYVTTGYATGVFSGKSNTGHNHVIGDVNNLQNCLDSISAFVTGEGLFAIKQKIPMQQYNQALGDYSVAMGLGAIAKQDYEIAHAAGWFVGKTPGSTQTSKLLFRHTTSTANEETIAHIQMDDGSVVSFSADVIGFGASSMAAFRLEGVACKNAINNNVEVLGGNSLTTFVNPQHLHVSGIADNTNKNVIITASGNGSSMNWITNINLLKIN
jgi:hypothetical protein